MTEYLDPNHLLSDPRIEPGTSWMKVFNYDARCVLCSPWITFLENYDFDLVRDQMTLEVKQCPVCMFIHWLFQHYNCANICHYEHKSPHYELHCTFFRCFILIFRYLIILALFINSYLSALLQIYHHLISPLLLHDRNFPPPLQHRHDGNDRHNHH
jgi:hypothetical protein